MTAWTVEPERYGDFLIAIYEEWVRQDVGEMFVMNFEWSMSAWVGEESPVCIFSRRCGRAVALEHNGNLYACDHYVYPEYQLGNVLSDNLGEMVEQSVASGFGPHKETSLPAALVPGVRCADVLLGRLPQTSLYQHPRWRTGASLPVRRLQKILPAHPEGPAARSPSCCSTTCRRPSSCRRSTVPWSSR